jgi:hypothetical protein
MVGVWLMARPYIGIWGDSIIYIAQALNIHDPELLANDIFFKYGSQGDFTLFPRVHAQFIKWLGIEDSAFFLTLIGKLIWFFCLYYLVSALTQGWGLIVGLAMVLGYPPQYDGYEVFSYGESMLTSRIYAESLVLLSISLAIRNHLFYAIAFVVCALLFHPLIALVGVFFVFVIGLIDKGAKAIFIYLATGVLLFLLVVYFNISPFDRLFSTYDPAWLDVVEKRNVFIFIENWSNDAFSNTALILLLLMVNYHFSRGVIRWFSAWLALFGLASLLISWVGASVFANVLITQLQLWRGIWLVQLCSLAMLGDLAFRLWQGNVNQRILLILLGSALLLNGVASLMLAVFSIVFYWQLGRIDGWKPTRTVMIAVGGVFIYSLVIKFAFLEIIYSRHKYEFPFVLYATLSNELVLPLIVLISSWVSLRYGKPAKILVAATGFAVFLIGLNNYDVRSRRVIDGSEKVELNVLQALIPKNATVFWHGGVDQTWLWLQRAHYVSSEQMAGVLFSREMSLEARRRQRILEPFGFDAARYAWHPNDSMFKSNDSWKNNVDLTIASLCKDAALDFIIQSVDNDVFVNRIKPVFSSKKLDVFSCKDVQES